MSTAALASSACVPEEAEAAFSAQLLAWRARLDTRFAQVDPVFASCMAHASRTLTAEGLEAHLDFARFLGKMGRGVEPMLIFLATWPDVASHVGEAALPSIAAAVHAMWKSPNGKAITPFLQSLPEVARRLASADALARYLTIGLELMQRTTGSIHGHHQTFASPGLPLFFEQAPHVLAHLSVAGVSRWVDYGLCHHPHHPEHQRLYFSLQSADAKAVFQRERHGTLLADHTRVLDLYLRALWQTQALLIPFAVDPHQAAPVQPYFDDLGMRVPDVYDARAGISGLNRYRLALAHMAAHQRWSQPQIADNWSPMQRMAVETFEDARIDLLLLRHYPGLRPTLLALHPHPAPQACDASRCSCLRHRLAMLSRAVLDDAHGYTDPILLYYVEQIYQQIQAIDGKNISNSTRDVAALALSYVARTRRPSDHMAEVWFTDTEVDYRDDNRHLWIYLEQGDEEEWFDPRSRAPAHLDAAGLPPRLYPEWDGHSQTYRPDWVSLYERLHPSASPSPIDDILSRHAGLAKQLKRLLDVLKPQDKRRIRFQEEGTELDVDVALRSWVDFKSGAPPDTRIHMSHRTDGRHIAVLLLLDLSQSLNDAVAGSTQTVLDLSREAVTLLAWAIEQLGDKFAIAGFHSNTRHDVRYWHIKGFSERFDDAVKGRLAGLQAGYSTRMGAAVRHAGHYLDLQEADKKLLLVLTDGQPADIDTPDERQLIEDTRQAVRELEQNRIYTHCISLDPKADAYVSDIFSTRCTVIDHLQRLPERLPQLFMSLTR